MAKFDASHMGWFLDYFKNEQLCDIQGALLCGKSIQHAILIGLGIDHTEQDVSVLPANYTIAALHGTLPDYFLNVWTNQDPHEMQEEFWIVAGERFADI